MANWRKLRTALGFSFPHSSICQVSMTTQLSTTDCQYGVRTSISPAVVSTMTLPLGVGYKSVSSKGDARSRVVEG